MRYIAQKAGEALEAMCSRDSLTNRLKGARTAFAAVEGRLDTAPDEVRESITAFLTSKGGRGGRNGAALVSIAIGLSLVEFGRQDGRRVQR